MTEADIGRIIRHACEHDPTQGRFYLTCSIGELAQRLEAVSEPPSLVSPPRSSREETPKDSPVPLDVEAAERVLRIPAVTNAGFSVTEHMWVARRLSDTGTQEGA